ncbi:Cystine/glutamate transporter [Holothuria leucospilota]|uniref:Cystine/glutamate transporter n=1 Tax=Holothuria leucospilota TaxID=206669 RepID=A0A9Q1CBT2_HOLLE|nr:Cystine/glutamate transporter [Holothuria leucospilota]
MSHSGIASLVYSVSHCRTIVRAMAISFVCVTILYLLTNVAYFAVLTTEEIMSSDAVAATPITVLVIYSGNIWTVIDFLYCFAQIENILTIAIVPYLRWKKPERVLSYKAPLWSCVVFIAFTTVVLLITAYSNPIQIGITVAIICIALAYYWLIQLINKSDRFQAKLSKLSYKTATLLGPGSLYLEVTFAIPSSPVPYYPRYF